MSELISSDKTKIKELMGKNLKMLYSMANSEEYEIGRFIEITKKKIYKLLIIFKIATYIWLLFSFIVLPLIIEKRDILEFIDQPLLFSYIIIHSASLKNYGYSLSIYSVKRKWFLRYQRQLNLIINNKNINQLISENEELSEQVKFLNQKIDYIVKVLKTPLDFLKTYQFIGFFSLIIPVLISLFQNIVLSIDFGSYLGYLITLVFVFLIMYIFPRIIFWKQKEFLLYRDKLKENFGEIRSIQRRNVIVL